MAEHRRKFDLYSDTGIPALFEAISPAYYILRVFGLAPYVLYKDGRATRIRVSKIYGVPTLFAGLVYSINIYLLFHIYTTLRTVAPAVGYTITLKLILNFMVVMIDLGIDFSRRHRFADFLNALADFDKALSPSWDSSLRALKLRLFCFIGFIILLMALLVELSVRTFLGTYSNMIAYVLNYLGAGLGIFKLSGTMFLLKRRFARLNDLATRYGLRCISPKKLESLYNELLDMSGKLNDMYSWSLFIFISNLFSQTVVNVYFILASLDFRKNSIKTTTGLLMWMAIYLALLLILHVSCHSVIVKANRFPQILLEWHRRDHRLSEKLNIRTMVHYLNRRLTFTAGGCFDVQLPLMTSMFGHFVTYIVILLQIQSFK